MKRTKEISEELSLLSKIVAGISQQTPYQAPAGYFEDFSGRVMGLIREGRTVAGLSGGGFPVGDLSVGGPGSVEVDYSDLTIKEVTLPFPDQAARVNPYTVPAGYFEGFAQQMLDRIKTGQEAGNAGSAQSDSLSAGFGQEAPLSSGEELSLISPLLSRIGKKMPFEAPEGYFSELTAAVISGAQAIDFVNDELENLSPLMASLRNKTTYQAPEGYFDGVAGRVLEQLQQPVTAKVISMHRKRNWLRYSVAAAVAGLLLTGGWRVFHKPSSFAIASGFDLTKSLSGVSDQELENYLDNHNVSLAEAATNSTATIDFTENDIKGMLGDVSDAELRQYQEDQGSVKEPATN